jgi:hypothetical protein
MQFPTIPSQKVTPVVRRDVTAVYSATAVAGSDRKLVSGSSAAVPAGEPPIERPLEADRRQAARRDAADRRRRQVPVMLDTRTGRDRRGDRRRADDPPAAGVNEAV